MTYLEYLKSRGQAAQDDLDSYVIFLLDRGFSVADTARIMEISRQAVYNTISRQKTLYEAYIAPKEQK